MNVFIAMRSEGADGERFQTPVVAFVSRAAAERFVRAATRDARGIFAAMEARDLDAWSYPEYVDAVHDETPPDGWTFAADEGERARWKEVPLPTLDPGAHPTRSGLVYYLASVELVEDAPG